MQGVSGGPVGPGGVGLRGGFSRRQGCPVSLKPQLRRLEFFEHGCPFSGHGPAGGKWACS